MVPNTAVPVLKGSDAKNFIEYQNREATVEEVEFMEMADKIYLSHCPDNKAKINTK